PSPDGLYRASVQKTPQYTRATSTRLWFESAGMTTLPTLRLPTSAWTFNSPRQNPSPTYRGAVAVWRGHSCPRGSQLLFLHERILPFGGAVMTPNSVHFIPLMWRATRSRFFFAGTRSSSSRGRAVTPFSI